MATEKMLSGSSDLGGEEKNIVPLDQEELGTGPPRNQERNANLSKRPQAWHHHVWSLPFGILCRIRQHHHRNGYTTDHRRLPRCWLVWLGKPPDHLCAFQLFHGKLCSGFSIKFDFFTLALTDQNVMELARFVKTEGWDTCQS